MLQYIVRRVLWVIVLLFVVSGLTLRAKNNTLYASTMGRGAYQRALN